MYHRRTAKRVSTVLKNQFGQKKSYSASELEEVIRLVGLSARQREFAYAMFTDEAVCDAYLARVHSKRTARELRSNLGNSLFGNSSAVAYDASWNRFHDYDNKVMGGLAPSFCSPITENSWFGGGECDGGFDNGGDGGGGCDGGGE